MPFCKHVVNRLKCVFDGNSTSEMNGFKGGGEGVGDSFVEGRDAGAVRVDGSVSFAQWHDALQCVGSAPFFQRSAAKHKCPSPFAFRPGFGFAQPKSPLKKKSPPAFAEGLLKLGFDLWIIC
jgi:hypothetical protein